MQSVRIAWCFGWLSLSTCACDGSSDSHARDAAMTSGGDVDATDLPDEDAGAPTDAGTRLGADGEACSGWEQNPASCPCHRPEAGTACSEPDLSCMYDVEICTCRRDRFGCSLPLQQ